ncbi:hypothetical protein EDB89DRAFT_2245056 [Lactarius sanguifluus]|nr:hypothetical protein EDB89DRAFT_2245056 [Lactarius sanguifluus]
MLTSCTKGSPITGLALLVYVYGRVCALIKGRARGNSRRGEARDHLHKQSLCRDMHTNMALHYDDGKRRDVKRTKGVRVRWYLPGRIDTPAQVLNQASTTIGEGYTYDFERARRGIQFYATSLGCTSCMRVGWQFDSMPWPRPQPRGRVTEATMQEPAGMSMWLYIQQDGCPNDITDGVLRFVSSSGSNMVEDAQEESSVSALAT